MSEPVPELPVLARAAANEIIRLRAELARRDEQIAAAWDEGQASGWSRAMRYMTDEPHLPRAVNPYRGAS